MQRKPLPNPFARINADDNKREKSENIEQSMPSQIEIWPEINYASSKQKQENS
jgi:hypothetical protein